MSSDTPLPPDQLPPDQPPLPKSLAERLAYLQLDEQDAERLRALKPHFSEWAAEFADAFYRHLFAFEQSARFLRDPQTVERLKRAQQEHFESLLEASWDNDYAERRHRIGQTHAHVGIEPELFLGAYQQYLHHSLRHCLAIEGQTLSPQLESFLSLLKVVFLDIGLTLDAYFTQATQDLRRALDLYWRANAELRQFAQLTSHDLKTPLATVANYCEEAIDEFGSQMPEGAKQLIEAARQRTFRMSAMIDELLSVTTSLNSAEQRQEVPVAPILDDVLGRLQSVLKKKEIEVVVNQPLPTVWGEPVRLREAIYNVLANAAKFIEQTPGRITIDVVEADHGWDFSVLDTGPGIPAENVEQIFAPFRRLPRHKNRPGSGLGLYFTKTMIEQLGGRIWAEARPQAGGCIHFWLPKPPAN